MISYCYYYCYHHHHYYYFYSVVIFLSLTFALGGLCIVLTSRHAPEQQCISVAFQNARGVWWAQENHQCKSGSIWKQPQGRDIIIFPRVKPYDANLLGIYSMSSRNVWQTHSLQTQGNTLLNISFCKQLLTLSSQTFVLRSGAFFSLRFSLICGQASKYFWLESLQFFPASHPAQIPFLDTPPISSMLELGSY